MPFALTDKFRHLASFEPFHIPTERSPTPKTTLPHALRYTGTPSLEAAVAALKTLPVTDLLAQGGGALFVRGLPVLTPEEIATAVLAFGGGVGSEYKQVGVAGIRRYVGEELQTANEGPPSLRFYQHNEWARFSSFPSKIFFACHTFSPESGGKTPLTSSVEVFKRAYEELPELVEGLAKHGLVSQQYYPPPGLEGSDNGFHWKQASGFGAEILPEDDEATARRKAEKAAEHFPGSTVTWTEEGGLLITMRVPAIRRVDDGGWNGKGTPTFFNGLTGRFGMIKQRGALDPPHIGTDGMKYPPPTYGDGSPILREWLLRLLEIQDEVTVKVPWQPGDIALLDNYIVQHGRIPWVGKPEDRVIFTSLRDDGVKLIAY